jgi:phage gpG-like protein
MAGAATYTTFDQLARHLTELGGKVAALSFERPLKTAAVYLASQSKECFDQSRDPSGVAWLPLKSPSARRGGPRSKPLRDTGLLMASVAARGAGHVEEVTRTSLVVGTSIDYASYHQLGTSSIPARPFLGITAKIEDRIARIILDYVKRELS